MGNENIEKFEKIKEMFKTPLENKSIYEHILCAIDSLKAGVPVKMILGDNLDLVSIEALAQIKEICKDKFIIYKLIKYEEKKPSGLIKIFKKLKLLEEKESQLPNSSCVGKKLIFENEHIDGDYDTAQIIDIVDPKGLEYYKTQIFGKYERNSVELKTPQEIRNLANKLKLERTNIEERCQ